MQASHMINCVFQPCLTARMAQGTGPHPLQSLERHGNLECNKSRGDSYQMVLEHVQEPSWLLEPSTSWLGSFVLYEPGPIFSKALAFA